MRGADMLWSAPLTCQSLEQAKGFSAFHSMSDILPSDLADFEVNMRNKKVLACLSAQVQRPYPSCKKW